MELHSIFSALSDPTRITMIQRLADEGEVDATAFAETLPISQPAVSRHLKVLEEAGWITRRRVGTRRPVRLAGQRLDDIAIWSGRLREALNANYTRLDALLDEGNP